MKYLYESHLGDLYITDTKRDPDSLYCKQCGDFDWFLGTFETVKDFWRLIRDDWTLQYIYPIMVETFGLPDEVKYKDDYERDSGFCCNSDEEILARILELIKENKHDK